MRRLFLIRHGCPDTPVGKRICLGRTDPPLSALGRMQACLLREALQTEGLTAVYASPLKRSRETAAALQFPLFLEEGFAEQAMGEWDGLDFETIRADWPDLYTARGSDPLLVPPRAETLAAVQDRAQAALFRCLAETEGDIAVAAHASVIQTILLYRRV